MRLVTLTLMAMWSASVYAETVMSVDADTGLATWQADVAGIQVRLTQISPDQARGFYQARGFSPDAAERYASQCVFMTVVRNVGDQPIEHQLSGWRYESAGQAPRAIRSKADWERVWTQLGVAESARIAFTWAQFPDTQTFAPGDWNQGMTTYSMPRGGQFDLHFAWRSGEKTFHGKLEQVRCADENA